MNLNLYDAGCAITRVFSRLVPGDARTSYDSLFYHPKALRYINDWDVV